jgi:hypothetical protein
MSPGARKTPTESYKLQKDPMIGFPQPAMCVKGSAVLARS